MNLETYTINTFQKDNGYIGDDAAVVGTVLYSQDAFFENVHFKTSWMNYYQIGYKAVVVNVSDAIAMNAQPMFALLTLALPKTMSKHDVFELSRGIKEACAFFKCEIIGGDTIANTKLDISITIVSHSKTVLRRETVKSGDLLAYTGTLGQSAKELKTLFRKGSISSKGRFVRPVLRQAFVRKARRLLNSGMDISDGLFSDVQKLSYKTHANVRFDKKISKAIGCSGEEYEMLVSFPKRHKKALLRIAKHTRTPLTLFGTMARTKKQHLCKANHF